MYRPLPPKRFHHQCEERLAVGLLVQRLAAVGVDDARSHSFGVEPLDFGRHVEEALRAQEEAVPRLAHPLRDAEVLVQVRMGRACAEAEVFRPALGIEAAGDGDGLEQRRFARAVLADDIGNARMKLEHVEMAYRG